MTAWHLFKRFWDFLVDHFWWTLGVLYSLQALLAVLTW